MPQRRRSTRAVSTLVSLYSVKHSNSVISDLTLFGVRQSSLRAEVRNLWYAISLCKQSHQVGHAEIGSNCIENCSVQYPKGVRTIIMEHNATKIHYYSN